MSAELQHDIAGLLEQAGARPRGNRHDCPKCGGLRTVTHSDEAFFCHKCGWKGNAVSLAKELGVYQRVPRAEFLRRQRAREAAERLYHAVHRRELDLFAALRDLALAEDEAHVLGPDDETAWDILAASYRDGPSIEAELAVLEGGGRDALLEMAELGVLCGQALEDSRRVN